MGSNVCHVSRIVGELERAGELEGVTVFEAKTVRTGQKRKRDPKGDPGDIDGYMGPWRGYEDQQLVAKPTEEQRAILEERFGDKQKKKQEKEETIEETSMIHSKYSVRLTVNKHSGVVVCVLLTHTQQRDTHISTHVGKHGGTCTLESVGQILREQCKVVQYVHTASHW